MILRVVNYSSAAWYGKKEIEIKQKPGPIPKIIDTEALNGHMTQKSAFKSGTGFLFLAQN